MSQRELVSQLEDNKKRLEELLKFGADITYREFTIEGIRGFIVYVDDLIDPQYLSSSVLQPMMELSYSREQRVLTLEYFAREVLYTSKIEFANTYDDVIGGILSGKGGLFLDDSPKALLLSTKGKNLRNISPPDTEVNVRGSREGFVEDIGINISLLRRRLKDENLKFEVFNLGERTKTIIYVAYIQDLVNPKLVAEVRERLNKVDIEGVLESGYIEQLIEDSPKSIFPTIGNTEKPDKLAGKLLEGRVGIIVDGTPFALTVPYLLIEAFQNTEDYYSRPYFSSIMRLVRLLAFAFTTMLPAFYVALQSYHQEMIPTTLLINMSSGREGIPFPAIVEVVLMGVIFEILREAGVRMPRTVGQAVSIVGALVLGETAVLAGLVSPNLVIVVALTAISGFLIPPLTASISIMRLYFLISTAFLGLFGWLLSFMIVLIHLNSIRSFGLPYLSPIIPLNLGDMKDGLVRFPSAGKGSMSSLLSYRGSKTKSNGKKGKKVGIKNK